jgi:hypothetical protein
MAPSGEGGPWTDICTGPIGENPGQSAPSAGYNAYGTRGAQAPLAGKSDLQASWFATGLFTPDASQNGKTAANGNPGGGGAGGGGGGACLTVTGGNAGAGGAGGCGGHGGSGGGVGGAGVAIVGNGAKIAFGSGVVVVATGGAGGKGGAAGAGGKGGKGGSGEMVTARTGGDGSAGGPGGAGGDGSGGNGGPALCVLQHGTLVPVTGFMCTTTGGAAGAAAVFTERGFAGATASTLTF